MVLQVGAASVRDHDGAGPRLKASRGLHAFTDPAFADAACAGERVAAATLIAVGILRKQAGQVGFAMLPRRRVIERSFASLGRNRRLARDLEATIASAMAFPCAIRAMLLTRRPSRCA